jgi:hypothetical protein
MDIGWCSENTLTVSFSEILRDILHHLFRQQIFFHGISIKIGIILELTR